MKSLLKDRRVAATLMLGVIAAALIAPAAEAGHGYGHRRWKSGPREVRYVQPAPVPHYAYRHHHSDAAPLFAGLVGGLILGSVLSNSQPAVHAGYSYWDPYCDESFGSLEIYRSHVRHCSHPRVVRVIEVSNGRHVRDLCWRDDAWRVYDDGGDRWDDRSCEDD